jgi:hypothetical protein
MKVTLTPAMSCELFQGLTRSRSRPLFCPQVTNRLEYYSSEIDLRHVIKVGFKAVVAK